MFHDDPRAPPMWSPWRPRPQGWDTYVKQLRNGAERLDVLATGRSGVGVPPLRTRGRQGRTADLLPTPRPIERNTMPPLHTIPHRIVGKPCAGDHDEIAPAYTRRR